MVAIKFILFFILSHVIAYTLAGAIALAFSKDIYENKTRHCNFLRDMSDPKESKHVSIYFLPAQLLRSLLMAIILLPLLKPIIDLPFFHSTLFFIGLMFIYTHFAAVSPFIDNIEGFVYFKKKYLKKIFIIKFQIEMIIYAIIFGLLLSTAISFFL